jgi:hypothetical protein
VLAFVPPLRKEEMDYCCIQQPQKIHESCFGVSALKHAKHKLETNISDAPYSSIHDIALNDALTWHAAAAIAHVLAAPSVTAYVCSLRFLRKRANFVAGSWRGAFGWGQKVSGASVASARCNLFFQRCSTA